ncbi:hypothetical protein RND71_039585 [Anisodus tanguticus]|uniref:Uncharacterized protein n=1 Tax=Anisodus tanguticus TaxID=243964 RepID=A0AAE1QW49_9SOLA|nr:hypothetical protein RND71_039585 [Anisodus tanguticus]
MSKTWEKKMIDIRTYLRSHRILILISNAKLYVNLTTAAGDKNLVAKYALLMKKKKRICSLKNWGAAHSPPGSGNLGKSLWVYNLGKLLAQNSSVQKCEMGSKLAQLLIRFNYAR